MVSILRTRCVGFAAATALAACACAHAPNENLQRAEAELEGATADPNVAQHAPLALEDARRSVERAQRAQRSGDSETDVDHLAYLASRRIEIARLSAQREVDVERAEDLSRRREVVASPPIEHPYVRLEETTVRLEEIQFDGGRTTLDATERAHLEGAAVWMRSHPSHDALVEGHADETESDPVAVSEQRASNVADELVRHGVPPERVRIRGLGDARPLAGSDTSSGRALNRRVEILAEPVSTVR